jgi:dual specificity tyrosine-phosphorylation-regulated kinase 2/3/4
MYALKAITKNQIDQDQLHSNIEMERKILLQIDHPFIMKLVKNLKDQHNIYFLMEFVKGKELWDIIRNIGVLTKYQAQFYTCSMFLAIDYLHSRRFVYRDMKPENILVRKINKSGIKVIDFGSGCFENEKIYTYIQSRFYRAPEIVLGIPYTTAIDMWSYGCILFELYMGYPLFPGEDEKEHMAMMMEIKGVPPRSVLARATRRKVFFDEEYQPIIVPNSKGKMR